MNKKLKFLLSLGIMMMMLTGCSLIVAKDKKVNVVNANVIIDKMKNRETFAFVIGAANCSACVAYLNELDKLGTKDEIILDYIDLDILSSEEIKVAQELVTNYLNNNFEATPTTFFIVDGEVSSYEIGLMTYEQLLKVYNSKIEKEDGGE